MVERISKERYIKLGKSGHRYKSTTYRSLEKNVEDFIMG
jgi:hypothetical protein